MASTIFSSFLKQVSQTFIFTGDGSEDNSDQKVSKACNLI